MWNLIIIEIINISYFSGWVSVFLTCWLYCLYPLSVLFICIIWTLPSSEVQSQQIIALEIWWLICMYFPDWFFLIVIMLRRCIVPGCQGTKPLHRFPSKQTKSELRKWWIDRICHPDVSLSRLTDNSRLCDVSLFAIILSMFFNFHRIVQLVNFCNVLGLWN
jgi:hypothetical protein